MYREERDTLKWFKPDNQHPVGDRENLPLVGPGKYETEDKKAAFKSQVSWNLGKIPFKSGDDRFKQDDRGKYMPGPASYNPNKTKDTKPELPDRIKMSS
jgi:hypothetical protein